MTSQPEKSALYYMEIYRQSKSVTIDSKKRLRCVSSILKYILKSQKNASEALRLNETYLKVRVRRAELYEENDQPHESQEDWKLVLEANAENRAAKAALARLPAKIEIKNEKLKAEMFDGMKKLGNMCLKPFGLSTENFKLGSWIKLTLINKIKQKLNPIQNKTRAALTMSISSNKRFTQFSIEIMFIKTPFQMVKIARPSRIVSEFDTLDVYFTGCSVLDGQLTLWGQLNGIDDPDVSLLTQLDERINAESETPELERVVPGDTYLVKYTLDNKWYRAKVMNYYTGFFGRVEN